METAPEAPHIMHRVSSEHTYASECPLRFASLCCSLAFKLTAFWHTPQRTGQCRAINAALIVHSLLSIFLHTVKSCTPLHVGTLETVLGAAGGGILAVAVVVLVFVTVVANGAVLACIVWVRLVVAIDRVWVWGHVLHFTGQNCRTELPMSGSLQSLALNGAHCAASFEQRSAGDGGPHFREPLPAATELEQELHSTGQKIRRIVVVLCNLHISLPIGRSAQYGMSGHPLQVFSTVELVDVVIVVVVVVMVLVIVAVVVVIVVAVVVVVVAVAVVAVVNGDHSLLQKAAMPRTGSDWSAESVQSGYL